MKLCLCLIYTNVLYKGLLLTLSNKHCLGNRFKIVVFRRGKVKGKGEINLVFETTVCNLWMGAFARAFAQQKVASCILFVLPKTSRR